MLTMRLPLLLFHWPWGFLRFGEPFQSQFPVTSLVEGFFGIVSAHGAIGCSPAERSPVSMYGVEGIVIIGIHLQSQADLMLVVDAFDAQTLGLRPPKSGHKHPCQYRNDRNDHEQLNQGEG